MSNSTDVTEKTKVGPVLLGDGGYSLIKWLIKHTFSPALSPQEKNFSKALSSARVVVERSFGGCKARWRCLLKQLDNRVENVCNVIITCFTLHNFCQLNGEHYFDDDGILDELIENERRA